MLNVGPPTCISCSTKMLTLCQSPYASYQAKLKAYELYLNTLQIQIFAILITKAGDNFTVRLEHKVINL